MAILGFTTGILVTPSKAAAVSQPAAITITRTPTAAQLQPAGMTTKVAYGSGSQQWVHLYRPLASGRRPAVIFVHGGGWVGGGVSMWQSEADYWSRKGWVSVNASYTLGTSTGGHDDGKQMLADMGSVLTLVRSLPYVDRSKILVVGDSAGGHLAAYLAARHYGKLAGMILWSPVGSPSIVRSVGARWDGASDCPTVCIQQRSLANRASILFGYSDRTTSPLTYLDHYGKVPTWVAGSRSEWVPYAENGGAICAASASVCSQHVAAGDLHATKLRDANPALVVSARHWAAKTVGVKAF